MTGPLGALPALSPAARRALAGSVALAMADSMALVVAAWSLSGALAAIINGTRLGAQLAIFAAAIGVRALLSWAGRTVAARAAAGAKEDLRGHLLDAATRLGPEWIDQRHPAELTALATTGLDALDDYCTRFLPALVGAAVVVPLVGLAILVADWRAAVIIAVTVPLIPLFAALIGRFTQGRVSDAADAAARLAGQLLELVRALPVLTAFGRGAAQERAVHDASERHRVATRATLRVAFLSAFALDVLATLSVALVAVDIGLRLLGAELGLATALFVLILAPECYVPLRAVGAAYHASEDGLEAVRRVAEIVGAEGDPVPEGVRPEHLRHQLDITELSVHNRITAFSIRLTPGQIVRLDLPSGAGKSTVIGAVLGFVQPTSGGITVDGAPLSTLDLDAWRRQVAWVPQRPRFTGPLVVDELRMVADDITEAAEAAVVTHLLHRPVHELSAGERQRVALARALLRLHQGAWLLLADEPTAHVDHPTAAHLTAAIEAAAARGAAVLVATHTTVAADLEPVPATEPITTVVPAQHHTRISLRRLVDRRLLAGALLGALALGSAVALTATAAWLIARASQHPSIVVLSVAVIGVRAFGLAKGTLRYAERLVTHDSAFRLATCLRVNLWRALVRIGPARVPRDAEGMRRLVNDVDAVRDLVPRVLPPPIVAAIVAVGAITLQTVLLPTAGLLLAGALAVAGLAGPLLGLLAERRASSAAAAGRRRMAEEVFGLFDTAADLIAFGAHHQRRAALRRLDADLAATARRQAWGAGLAGGIATAALGAAALGSTWLAIGHVNPVLTAVLALVPLAMAETIDGLAPALRLLDPLRAAYTRVTEPNTLPPAPRATHGDVNLTNATISWPDATTPALRDVTLHIPPGTEVAVVGPSGAGKSTLLALLLGFLTPDTGWATVPATVAWCPSDPQLAATTVRENLRLGDATASDDTLRAALRAVALDDWTDRLDTRIGPNSAGASGGEARRLALARALLRAPHADLVLLDEPTAHLDEPTAARVLANLRRALAGRTVVLVTHRPTEARDATMVLSVDNGQVSVHFSHHPAQVLTPVA
jgi:thiol reductant ABC exporter CydD subunit/thiol reductant ABC exporter CydC subunit